MIRVLFFARLREELGEAELTLAPAPACVTVGGLLGELRDRGEAWDLALGASNVLCAVNQQQVDCDHPVRDGDEVAFFPPVTGG